MNLMVTTVREPSVLSTTAAGRTAMSSLSSTNESTVLGLLPQSRVPAPAAFLLRRRRRALASGHSS